MQHTHVKRKEKPMNRYMMEEFHNDPAALRRRLSSAAHRERSRAVGAAFLWLIGRPAALLARLKARITARRGPARWLARLG
jgi:hypothetical protein